MTAEPRRVLAVDGGQSTVRVRHSNGATGEAPGVSWGGADTVAACADAVVTAWRAAGAPPTQVAVLALTTVPEGSPGLDRLAELVSRATGADRVLVCDDGIAAHAGALGGSWGMVLAVGTGVACVARSRTGQSTLIGGHGYLIGDEGGAYWIGRAGISSALRAAEGRGIPTDLTTLAADVFGDLRTAHIRIHADPRAVDNIARFAPSVIGVGRAGDAAARSILDDALGELIGCVRAGWVAAGAESATPLAVVGRFAAELRPELDESLTRLGEMIDLRRPVGGPLEGAMQLAADPSGYGDLVHTWTRG